MLPELGLAYIKKSVVSQTTPILTKVTLDGYGYVVATYRLTSLNNTQLSPIFKKEGEHITQSNSLFFVKKVCFDKH